MLSSTVIQEEKRTPGGGIFVRDRAIPSGFIDTGWGRHGGRWVASQKPAFPERSAQTLPVLGALRHRPPAASQTGMASNAGSAARCRGLDCFPMDVCLGRQEGKRPRKTDCPAENSTVSSRPCQEPCPQAPWETQFVSQGKPCTAAVVVTLPGL